MNSFIVNISRISYITYLVTGPVVSLLVETSIMVWNRLKGPRSKDDQKIWSASHIREYTWVSDGWMISKHFSYLKCLNFRGFKFSWEFNFADGIKFLSEFRGLNFRGFGG